MNRKNWSTLIIKRSRKHIHTRMFSTIYRTKASDFCTNRPWIWPHTAAPDIFLLADPSAPLCVRRNRSTQRTSACMRHTLLPSANAYAEWTLFVRGSLKTRRFYLAKPSRTDQLTKGADVTFESKANGRRDATVNRTLP